MLEQRMHRASLCPRPVAGAEQAAGADSLRSPLSSWRSAARDATQPTVVN